MKTTISFVFLCYLSACLPSMAQSKDFKGKYASFFEAGEVEKLSAYHFVITKTQDKHYIERFFFPETKTLTDLTSYRSRKLKVKDGPSKTWWDTGARKSEGTYENDERTSTWKTYHDNDQLSSTGTYEKGLKTGIWKTYDKMGRLTSEYTYEADLLSGAFVTYDSLQQKINEGIYRADTIYQATQPVSDLQLVEEMPYLSSCKNISNQALRQQTSTRRLLESVYKNIKYPADARIYGIEGTAYVRFAIEKDGTISDIKVTKGLCQSIATTCADVVKNLPPWEPGKQEGKAVKVYFNLPVKFRLE